jgi:aspartate/methionine/tyrosine aminotransferase
LKLSGMSRSVFLQRSNSQMTVPPSAILPSIGSKELVANLPTVLGLGADSHVVVPLAAYPTYAVGAGVLGARVTATDQPEDVSDADLIWINSPGNPTGRVMASDQMRSIVAHARSTGAVVASDECYVELGWEATPFSVLHPSIVGSDHSGVLALHSLSKRSNFAGYRFGFVAGDPELVQRMLGIRKHLGMMVPSPIQAAAPRPRVSPDRRSTVGSTVSARPTSSRSLATSCGQVTP